VLVEQTCQPQALEPYIHPPIAVTQKVGAVHALKLRPPAPFVFSCCMLHETCTHRDCVPQPL
jgi:hypothetical protein